MDDYEEEFYQKHRNDRIGMTEYKLKDLPNWAKKAQYLHFKQQTHQAQQQPTKST